MAFRKYFSLLILLSVVSIVWVFYLSPSTKSSIRNTVQPLQFQPRLYQINNVTVDFSLASSEFENKVIQYFRQSTVTYYRISNETKSPTITISPSPPTKLVDIFVVSNMSSNFISSLERTPSYILFEETIDTLNFTFEFVQVNREWNHFFPPVIFVDAVTRINFFHLETPVILLKRAPPEFRPIINTLWELQHPNDCENVVTLFPSCIMHSYMYEYVMKFVEWAAQFISFIMVFKWLFISGGSFSSFKNDNEDHMQFQDIGSGSTIAQNAWNTTCATGFEFL